MQKQKRVRRNYTRVKILIGILVVLFAVIFGVVSNWTRIQLGFKGYDREARKILLELSDEEIDEFLDYDEVIDVSKWNKIDNAHHYYDYELYAKQGKSVEDTIHYIDSFYKQYHKALKQQGYSLKTQRILMKSLQLHEFEVLKEHALTWKQVKPYINIKGRIIEDIPAYIDAKKEPIQAVMQISYDMIDSSNPSQRTIERSYILNESEHALLLIKKGFYVPENYIPKKLVKVKIPNAPDNANDQMREDAAKALEQMYQDAKKKGLVLVVNSAYRSYKEQLAIYNEYFTIYDPVTAASLVAVPGSSEHQLGLSVDLTSQSVIDGTYGVFGSTPEYQWVVKNAHTYGFIMRYPGDKSAITGTANEPWHIRYVGVKAATEMYEKDLTLEEYTLKHGFSYDVALRDE